MAYRRKKTFKRKRRGRKRPKSKKSKRRYGKNLQKAIVKAVKAMPALPTVRKFKSYVFCRPGIGINLDCDAYAVALNYPAYAEGYSMSSGTKFGRWFPELRILPGMQTRTPDTAYGMASATGNIKVKSAHVTMTVFWPGMYMPAPGLGRFYNYLTDYDVYPPVKFSLCSYKDSASAPHVGEPVSQTHVPSTSTLMEHMSEWSAIAIQAPEYTTVFDSLDHTRVEEASGTLQGARRVLGPGRRGQKLDTLVVHDSKVVNFGSVNVSELETISNIPATNEFTSNQERIVFVPPRRRKVALSFKPKVPKRFSLDAELAAGVVSGETNGETITRQAESTDYTQSMASYWKTACAEEGMFVMAEYVTQRTPAWDLIGTTSVTETATNFPHLVGFPSAGQAYTGGAYNNIIETVQFTDAKVTLDFIDDI